MTEKPSSFKGIKDIFYETRVLMGRGYTLRRFAKEVLGDTVDPVMLSYIEKGKRFPNEPLVRKLAQIRGQDPIELLVLLWQGRILHAFARELRRVMKGQTEDSKKLFADAELAFLVTRAIAALPDNERWITIARWKRGLTKAVRELGKKTPSGITKTVIGLLKDQGLVEIRGNRVRRRGSHYVPGSPGEKQSLALEFCGIFTKGLLDKMVRQEVETYLRNHYLKIPEKNIMEFHRRLNKIVHQLVEEFASEESEGKFLNVLITSTPF